MKPKAIRKHDLLLHEAYVSGHASSSSLSETEARMLILDLVKRLETTSDQLDLSSSSLNRLSSQLTQYYMDHRIELKDSQFSLRLMREIAAYFGLALMKNANPEWVTGAFPYAHIRFVGKYRARKGRETRESTVIAIPLSPIATGTMDALEMGVVPKLYKSFKAATAQMAKEQM